MKTKITKNNAYWKARELVDKQEVLDKSILNIDIQLARQYRRTADKLIKKMRTIYAEVLANNPEGVLPSHLYQYNRYYEMLNQIQEELTKLGLEEQTILGNSMVKLYEDNQKILSKAFGISTDINKQLAEKVLNEYWVADNKLWSDRIWTNKSKFKQALEDGMFEAITTGSSVDQLTTLLMERCSANFNNAQRLARTELMHTYNTSSKDLYIRDGIKKVQISTASESVSNYNIGLNSNGTDPNNRQYQKMNSRFRPTKGEVCPMCQELSNNIYDIDKAPTLPIHCNCRCCYLPVIEDKNE